MMHALKSKLLNKLLKGEALDIAVVGVGGTGSEVLAGLTHLHLALKALDYHGGLNVTAFDPDTVSQANLVRQRYFQSDLGRNKAEVLIGRVNFSCGVVWRASPTLFNSDRARQHWDIVISCVDSRRSRHALHKAAFGKGFYSWEYWMDCGNDLTLGQVVIGTPGNARKRLKCATELHPELMDITSPEDDSPSCSAMEALQKQDLFVGRMVSTHALDLLWQLLRDRQLNHHARYFDLRQVTVAGRAC